MNIILFLDECAVKKIFRQCKINSRSLGFTCFFDQDALISVLVSSTVIFPSFLVIKIVRAPFFLR